MRVYAVHLKAGNTMPDSAQRHTEASDIRNVLNSVNVGAIGPNFMIGGDYNIYRATESSYIRLTESQADNDGRCKDPLLMPGEWNNNSGYALYMTQCPCLSGCVSGFSGGGMDDRFDFWLTSYSMQDGEGLDWTGNTIAGYAAYGNDGQHFNDDINGGGFNNAVGLAVANALHDASDHLPVVMVIQIPARVSVPSLLSFGMAQRKLPELLLTAPNAEVPDAFDFFFSALATVAERGTAPEEGERIPRSLFSRPKVTYAESPVEPGKRVWKVVL